MQQLNRKNEERVRFFIKKNIKKSLFIYGSLNLENIVLRFLERNEDIIGLYLISKEKYITFLFSDTITQEEENKILLDAQKFKHSEGTVVNPHLETFANFYEIVKEDKGILEVADLKPNKRYEVSEDIELLNIKDEIQRKEYVSVAATVGFNYSERFAKDYKEAKIYVIRDEDNRIISSAIVTAMSEYTAVIVGVFTVSEHRNSGYATKLLHHLIGENQTNNRMFFIFFNNPRARSIYLNIGFNITSQMIMFKNKN